MLTGRSGQNCTGACGPDLKPQPRVCHPLPGGLMFSTSLGNIKNSDGICVSMKGDRRKQGEGLIADTTDFWHVGCGTRNFWLFKCLCLSLFPSTIRNGLHRTQSLPGPLGTEQVWGSRWEDTELSPHPGSGLSCAPGQTSIQGQDWEQGLS